MLGELRAFDAVPELIAALDDPDDELCARACHALGKIGDPESAAPLAAVAMDGARPWFVRTAAAGACGQIGDPRTADTLVDVLDSEEWYPRNAAATALVPLGDAGLAAVCSRVGALEPESVAHYWGMLDAAGRHRGAIVRAAARRAPRAPFRHRRGARRRDRPAGGARRRATTDRALRDDGAGAPARTGTRPPRWRCGVT